MLYKVLWHCLHSDSTFSKQISSVPWLTQVALQCYSAILVFFIDYFQRHFIVTAWCQTSDFLKQIFACHDISPSIWMSVQRKQQTQTETYFCILYLWQAWQHYFLLAIITIFCQYFVVSYYIMLFINANALSYYCN